MKRIIGFSLVCASLLNASEATLDPITVESTTLNDISGEEVRSADLAEALSTEVPSINLIRRSGIANDVLLRGQKRDNINVTMDGTKVYGACPNRMDPPTSHVLTNNIESVEIIEGPYDVENFGTLSGAIKINMKEPSEEAGGEVSVNTGTWGYRKLSGTATGGNDRVQLLISASTEWGNQYEDGNDNTLAEQLELATTGTSNASKQYQSVYRDMEAFEKKTFMGKVNVNVTDDQQLKFSYTNNQSDDVLYPNSGMDALYDNSKIYNVEYIIRNLAPLSKKLSLQAYQSEVDHPMSNYYRKSALMMEMTSALSTKVQGARVKNSFEAAHTAFTVGLDASDRKWDGTYSLNGVPTGVQSIDDVETKNRAIFAEAAKRFGDLSVKVGMRYDDTSVTPGNTTQLSNDYEAFSANVFATYDVTSSTSIFAGAGKSSRVPDARELYFVSSDNVEVGTNTLNQTTNYEVDLGAEHKYEHARAKIKTFYSKLDDYIYYNTSNTTLIMKGMPPALTPVAYHAFENIDATIYGVELSGSIYPTDAISIDMGLAYQRGKKDRALAGQTDKDLADIPPLKGNLAVSYNYQNDSYARVEMIAADSWDTFDADNGEQKLGGYGIVNLKVSHDVNERFNLTAGLDNVFDKTYAVSNTYQDLTLLQGTGGDVMLLNEPGRYLYVNATYKF